jgi:hypothetical protein
MEGVQVDQEVAEWLREAPMMESGTIHLIDGDCWVPTPMPLEDLAAIMADVVTGKITPTEANKRTRKV